ncbi:hypothetical protein ACFQS3_04315 [Glycomyces mayteni]|uniref:Uncharacterized protein n=1 Tax=Glycomyces mayteni TaxID=543887 RepID=A0ABW2D5M9_9ACTN|nr:hypothetical protein GCM10025732_52280 [Glycomyces mayteni]
MPNTNEPRALIRRALAAGGALTAAAAAAAVMPVQAAVAAPGEEACVLQELPMPEDKYFSIVTGMSGDGGVVAYRAYPAGLETYERYPYLYEDGEVTEVPMPGEDQSLNGVNEDGVAVGSAWVDGVVLPYVYKDGVLTELAANDGGGASDVNDDGDIVGMNGQDVLVPVVWREGRVKPEALPLPEGASSGSAGAIDEDGNIAGGVAYDDGTRAPYVWHADGTGEELALPDWVDPAEVMAFAANDIAGEWVSGYLLTAEEENAVRWNLEDGTVEVLKLNYAPAINEDGLTGGARDPEAAVVNADSELTFLPGLVDPARNWFGDMVSEVSEDGERLAGQVFAGEDEAGNHILKAVLWECD